MKLLLYSHYFAPSIGGVETIVESLARGVADRRGISGNPEFSVTLVTQTHAGSFRDEDLPFRVIRRPSALGLFALIRNADVIHLAGPALPPLVLAWLARKPVVIEHHGYQAMCPNGLLLYQPLRTACPGHFLPRRYGKCLHCNAQEFSWLASLRMLLLTFARRALTQRADANLMISRHVLERHGVSRSAVVYYGIDDPLAKQPNGETRDTLAGRPVFAFVGRLVPEKGLPILLQAIRTLLQQGFDLELRIIGDGPERNRLDAMIQRLSLGSFVSLTGFLYGAGLRDVMRDVSVVLMPSIMEETAGLAAIEQMMRGRLVIASEIGGLGEVVGDSGLKCPPENADALVSAIRAVLEQPTIIQAMGKKARERASQFFTRQRMIDEHIAHWRRVRHDRRRHGVN